MIAIAIINRGGVNERGDKKRDYKKKKEEKQNMCECQKRKRRKIKYRDYLQTFQEHLLEQS